MTPHHFRGAALALALLASPATAQDAARAWSESLARERRMSGNTVEAYERDLRQFLGHLAARGGTPTIPAIVALKPRDIRAFMAARRADEVGGRSLMRALAGLRSFAKYLEREGHGTVAALGAVRSPKVERRLPRPLPVAAARALTEASFRADEDRAPWILMRDAAVLALLYGAGLRISEALGLTRRDAPVPGIDAVTVLGKGAKQRMVPVLPVVAARPQSRRVPRRPLRKKAPSRLARRRRCAGRTPREPASPRAPRLASRSCCVATRRPWRARPGGWPSVSSRGCESSIPSRRSTSAGARPLTWRTRWC